MAATAQQKTAASNQTKNYQFDKATIKDQLNNQLDATKANMAKNLDTANRLITSNNKTSEAERFLAHKNLIDSMATVSNKLGNSLLGSGSEALRAIGSAQQDSDNVTYWDAQRQSNEAAYNEYLEKVQSDYANMLGDIQYAKTQLRNSESQQSSNLNNISQDLYKAPSTLAADSSDGSKGYYAAQKKVADAAYDKYVKALANQSGYIRPNSSYRTKNT